MKIKKVMFLLLFISGFLLILLTPFIVEIYLDVFFRNNPSYSAMRYVSLANSIHVLGILLWISGISAYVVDKFKK